ncbi:MAG: hypothetical protein MPN21_24080 [Thermoanaerobaculia bacterium]|nr:hypothetical protein [Thermoanaerobaculia bacterium]
MLNLDCPAPPDTDVLEQPQFDYLAWNTFIALNWPAVVPSSENGFLRGFPDLGTSFVDAEHGSLTVWETFKEKREVFNHAFTPGGPGPWNQDYNYGPLRPAHGLLSPEPPTITSQRSLLQINKQSADSLDETAQVASEALELTLPDGEPNPVLGRPVGPRVWLGHPSNNSGLLYEVKVNYDFYQFVLANGYWVDNTQPGNPLEQDAVAGRIRLPYRTTAEAGPRQQGEGGPDHQQAVSYSAEATLDVYRSVTPTTPLNPPLVGAVHLKAAWQRLDGGQDPSRYHTAEAQYFVTDPATQQPVPRTALFGLVGLHIIQRVHTGQAGAKAAGSTGGTFVFATWEHVGNDAAGFTYANYYDPAGDPNTQNQPEEGFYPRVFDGQQPFEVRRKFQPISQQSAKYPGTQQVNEAVHAAIRARNPDSVWLNYRLIGTQFRAVDVNDTPIRPTYLVSENDPLGIGQQQFLANLVVETNEGLQHFQGLPPATPTIVKNRGIGVPSTRNAIHFDRSAPNTTFVRTPYNMGGCMGCHGVAQSRGYSFSFVLLDGYAGAATDTETNFEIPPSPIPTPNPGSQAHREAVEGIEEGSFPTMRSKGH